MGWNIYSYLNFGQRDLVIAVGSGVSHNAWAKHYEEDIGMLGFEFLMPTQRTIIDLGPLHVFVEQRSDPMTPFMFRSPSGDEEYWSFEFPWLLLFCIPAMVALIRMPSKTKVGEQAGGGNQIQR